MGVPTRGVSSFVCLLHGSLGRSSSKNEFLCLLQLRAGDCASGGPRVRGGSVRPGKPASVFSGGPGGHVLRRHPNTKSNSFRNSKGLFPPSKPGGFASDPARGRGLVCLKRGRLWRAGPGWGRPSNRACGGPAPRPDSGAGPGAFPDARWGPRLGRRRGTGGRPGWCLRGVPCQARLPPAPAGRPSRAGGRDLRRPHLTDRPCFGQSRAAGTRTT